jgi:hypothetical protein
MDLFDTTTDPAPIDSKSYQSVTGQFIWLLKIRTEIQLNVIMACIHTSSSSFGFSLTSKALLT